MHPLNTHQRRRLLAACLRIERQLRKDDSRGGAANRDKADGQRPDRQRLARFLRGGKPWDVTQI